MPAYEIKFVSTDKRRGALNSLFGVSFGYLEKQSLGNVAVTGSLSGLGTFEVNVSFHN